MLLNFTSELAMLMEFTGETATAIRMYSAYSGGSPSTYLDVPYDKNREMLDLMFLSDSLHHFYSLGRALQKPDPAHIVETCNKLLYNFSSYDTERPEFDTRQAKPTFERWKDHVDLTVAREALSSIRDKAAAAMASTAES